MLVPLSYEAHAYGVVAGGRRARVLIGPAARRWASGDGAALLDAWPPLPPGLVKLGPASPGGTVGEVAESWLIAHDSKSCRAKTLVGSNPTLSVPNRPQGNSNAPTGEPTPLPQAGFPGHWTGREDIERLPLGNGPMEWVASPFPWSGFRATASHCSLVDPHQLLDCFLS